MLRVSTWVLLVLTSNQSHAQIAKLTSHLMALAVAMPWQMLSGTEECSKLEYIQQH
jgi:hypothetical protein